MKGQRSNCPRLCYAATGLLVIAVLVHEELTLAQLKLQDVYQQVRPAVVFVQGVESGTGFFFHSSGCLLTAVHVVGTDNQRAIEVRLFDNSVLPARVLNRDTKNDVAVVKVEREGLTWVQLGDSDQVRVLDEVISIGFPGVLPTDEPTADTGRVQALRVSFPTYRIGPGVEAQLQDVIQVGGTIRQGSSGGPIFNPQGQVIGVVAATASSATVDVAYVVPINRAPIPALCTDAPGAPVWWGLPLAVVLGLVVVGSLGYWGAHRRRPDVLALLRQTPLFAKLSDAELQSLKGICQVVSFASGEVLLQEGDAALPCLYLILEGQVEIRSGQRRFGKRGVGRTVGEMSLLTGEPRLADVVALKSTRCLELTQGELENLLRQHPDIGIAMIVDLLHRLGEANRGLVRSESRSD